MSRTSIKLTQLPVSGSFRKEDGGQGRSTKDQTGGEIACLLEAIGHLEKEGSNLRHDISHLQTKLRSTQSKLYGDKSSSLSRTCSEQNYFIKMNHKFYEFTGVSIKKLLNNVMTVFFYLKHDDWTSDIRPYWLKLQISKCPKVVAYDFPFMVDMQEIQERHPIVSNDDVFAFVNYIRRCIESYFERRQQAHDLEKSLNSAYGKVFLNMQCTLIQIKLFARKSMPEIMFSVWYQDGATLPYKCVVRITDGSHEELIKKLTMEFIVLNTKPLPETFMEGVQKYLDLESSSEESSESDDGDTTELESWFLPLQTDVRKRSRTACISSTSKCGRTGAVVGGVNFEDDISRQPLAKRLEKLNNTCLIKENAKYNVDLTPLQRKGRMSKYDMHMKGGKSTQREVVPKVSTLKQVGTPWKYNGNWRKSDSSSPRKSRQTGRMVHSKAGDKRNSRPNVVENSSIYSKNTKENVSVQNFPKKSICLNFLESSKQNMEQKRVTELRQQAETYRSSPGMPSYRSSRQSSITNFLKPINEVRPKANTGMPKMPTPKERNVQPVLYENDFESEPSDDEASLHSADTMMREPRLKD